MGHSVDLSSCHQPLIRTERRPHKTTGVVNAELLPILTYRPHFVLTYLTPLYTHAKRLGVTVPSFRAAKLWLRKQLASEFSGLVPLEPFPAVDTFGPASERPHGSEKGHTGTLSISSMVVGSHHAYAQRPLHASRETQVIPACRLFHPDNKEYRVHSSRQPEPERPFLPLRPRACLRHYHLWFCTYQMRCGPPMCRR
jgi:hypothetical protein